MDEYRLILFGKNTGKLLAYWHQSYWRMPRIFLARQARPAEQAQRMALKTLGLRITILDVGLAVPPNAAYVVAEMSSPGVPSFLTPVPWEDTSTDLSEQEKDVLRAIVAGERGPVARPGWLDEAAQWIESLIPGGSVKLDCIRQYNAGGGFALVRLTMHDGRIYWLKATGEPNRREFDLTRFLAKIYPRALPTLVGARRDWNAWVMEDAGNAIEDTGQLHQLELAVTALASLQKACVGKRRELQSVGATDIAINKLKDGLPSLIEFLTCAMERQISTTVQRLSKERLAEMGELLQVAFGRLEELAIPDSLVLNDVNRGGILYDGSRCVLTDWAEAAVGNPFLTFQHICLLASKEAERAELRERYKRLWSDYLSEAAIERAFRLVPFLAIASYFYGRGHWLEAPIRQDPHFESHARSLARHLDRAARSEELRAALCA